MTREELEKDKAALLQQKEQLIANVNATSGAIGYIDTKLAALDTPADPGQAE